jgi:hypothetical protein
MPDRFFRYEINFYNKYRCRVAVIAAGNENTGKHVILAEFDNTQDADDLLVRLRDLAEREPDRWRSGLAEFFNEFFNGSGITPLGLFAENSVVPVGVL